MRTDTKELKLSDEELVDRIVKTKNTDLFAVLYDRYANKIYRKCLGFCKDGQEAQDLTHDIFIKLFVKLSSFRGDSKFSTWLYSFTYNFCVNYLTRNTHKKHENERVNEDYVQIPDKEPDDYSLYSLKSEKLKKALELIEPGEKMILLMKYQDEIPIKEIQVLFDLGESAVKMRLKRAKMKLLDVYKNI